MVQGRGTEATMLIFSCQRECAYSLFTQAGWSMLAYVYVFLGISS